MYIDYQHVTKEQVENNCYSNLPYITNSLRISVACLCHMQRQYNFPDVYQGHGGICAETNPTIVVCPALRPSLRHCERESYRPITRQMTLTYRCTMAEGTPTGQMELIDQKSQPRQGLFIPALPK